MEKYSKLERAFHGLLITAFFIAAAVFYTRMTQWEQIADDRQQTIEKICFAAHFPILVKNDGPNLCIYPQDNWKPTPYPVPRISRSEGCELDCSACTAEDAKKMNDCIRSKK